MCIINNAVGSAKLRWEGRGTLYLHNFDPKWVKKRLAPSKNPQNGLYVFCKHKNKTLFTHIARRISEAAIGGARAGDLIFHLCGPVERKKPMTRTA